MFNSNFPSSFLPLLQLLMHILFFMELVDLFVSPSKTSSSYFIPYVKLLQSAFLWFSGGIQHLLPSPSAFGDKLSTGQALAHAWSAKLCSLKVHVSIWGGLRLSYCGASRQHTYAALTEEHRRVQKYYVPNGFLFPPLLPGCFTYLGICSIYIYILKRWHCTKGTVGSGGVCRISLLFTCLLWQLHGA